MHTSGIAEDRPCRTMVVNLFGGPGCGKSTQSCGLYYRLKCLGIHCELVREYAKELVWEGSLHRLSNQVYVTAKQYHRQAMLDGKVDVLITDSPLLLGQVYKGRGCSDVWVEWLNGAFSEFDNLNIVLKRGVKYDPRGRMQTEDQAVIKDKELQSILEANGHRFVKVKVRKKARKTLDELVDLVIESYAALTGKNLVSTTPAAEPLKGIHTAARLMEETEKNDHGHCPYCCYRGH